MEGKQADFLMPNSEDKLFKDLSEDAKDNAIVRTGIDKFFLYSEGYKTAALKMSEQIGDAYSANLLVYPLIFMNRQFLELRLKELISGLNFVISQNHEFPNGHDLMKLWDNFKKLVLQVGGINAPDKAVMENAQRLIEEFNLIDPKSFSFRYPVDTTTERNPSLTITNIDLLNFISTMQKLYNFFDTQSDVVFHLIDCKEEFISAMLSNMESEVLASYENY